MESSMTEFRSILTWVIGICFAVAVLGIGYFYYQSQVEDSRIVREHTRQMTKRVLEVSEKLDRNGIVAADILKSNHELLKRLDEVLANHTLEMKTHRAFIIESHNKLHDELAKILATQKDETVEAISAHQKESRAMFMVEFERLANSFEVNREMHRQTQRFLKVPQEVK